MRHSAGGIAHHAVAKEAAPVGPDGAFDAARVELALGVDTEGMPRATRDGLPRLRAPAVASQQQRQEGCLVGREGGRRPRTGLGGTHAQRRLDQRVYPLAGAGQTAQASRVKPAEDEVGANLGGQLCQQSGSVCRTLRSCQRAGRASRHRGKNDGGKLAELAG